MKQLLWLAVLVTTLGQSGAGQTPATNTQPQTFAKFKVVSASGNWSVDGKTIVRGDEFPDAVRISLRGSGSLLVECEKLGLFFRTCKSGCPFPVQNICSSSSQTSPENGAISIGFNIAALFRREPKEPIVAAGRAGGNPEDAVLLIDDRGVHWGPAFRRVLEGNVCFQVKPVAPTNRPERRVTLDWDGSRDDLGVPPTRDLEAGLYQIEKGVLNGSTCSNDADASPVWVLTVPRPQFEQTNTEWNRTAALIMGLQRDGVPLPTLVALRRGALASLDDQRTTR